VLLRRRGSTLALGGRCIEHCRAMLAGFPLAVEFRNKTWFDSERHIARTLALERDNGLVNVVVDEPPGIANTIPGVWA
jgi:uncharacterized protein YecE (DUF72 family)